MTNTASDAGFGKIIGVICLLGCFLATQPLKAAGTHDVSLVWDKSLDPNVVGYVIYYGPQSSNYSMHIQVGNTNSTTLSLPTDGATYYIAATCCDAEGNESDFSNETTITTATASVANPLETLTGNGFVNGHFGFSVNGVAGGKYIIQVSSNLVSWESVYTNTSPYVYSDPAPAQSGARYYRPVLSLD